MLPLGPSVASQAVEDYVASLVGVILQLVQQDVGDAGRVLQTPLHLIFQTLHIVYFLLLFLVLIIHGQIFVLQEEVVLF